MQRNYAELIPQIEALIAGETDLIANLSNIAGALKPLPGYFWVGFYLVKGEELVLGPFQGPVACTRIGFGKGVCGASWARNESILVEDVHTFPGHIACNENSRSEVVVPVRNPAGKVVMVLDVDSDQVSAFSERDVEALEELSVLITKNLKPNA